MCKHWTEPHPPSQRSSRTQRVMSTQSSFPRGFRVRCTRSSGSTRVLPCGIPRGCPSPWRRRKAVVFKRGSTPTDPVDVLRGTFELFCHSLCAFLAENLCVRWEDADEMRASSDLESSETAGAVLQVRTVPRQRICSWSFR